MVEIYADNPTTLIKSGLAKLNLRAPEIISSRITQAPDFSYRIPGAVVEENIPVLEPQIPVLDIRAGEDIFSHIWTDEHLQVSYSDTRLNSPNCFAQDKYLARDLVWIVMPILEANRQTNRQFLAHSSAVERDGRGVVFFGQTHSGKSLLSGTLGFRYGFNIVGTEHTLLGENGIEGGSHIMYCSKGLKKFLPELPVEDPVGEPWSKENRTSLDLREIGKHSSGADISGLVYVSACGSDSDLKVVEWGRRKTLTEMGDWLRWMINASQTYIHNCESQMPPLDTLEISRKRMTFIEGLVDRGIRINFIQGPSDQIARTVLKKFYE